MKKQSPLEKLLNTPDDLIPDDDHPFRKPILTDEEVDIAFDELKAKFFNKDGSRKKLPKEGGEK